MRTAIKEETVDDMTSELIGELYIPTNDNMRKNLFENVKSVHGKYLSDIIEGMFELKEYVKHIKFGEDGHGYHLSVSIHGAEDIPGRVIDNLGTGITGSDFLLDELYKRPSWGFKEDDGSFVDPRSVYPDKIDMYTSYTFDRNGKLVPMNREDGIIHNDKILEVTFLKQGSAPRMCILGADDRTYEGIVKQRNEERKKVRVVYEGRFRNVARALLENLGINYKYKIVTRKAEADINRPLSEPMPDGSTRVGWADMGIEIGETFGTARANRLVPYMDVFKTYPVYIKCYRS